MRVRRTFDSGQVHSYAQKGQDFQESAPFKHSKANYQVLVPVVVGEFSPGNDAHGEGASELYTYVHEHGYDGAWGYAADGADTPRARMLSLCTVLCTHAPSGCACTPDSRLFPPGHLAHALLLTLGILLPSEVSWLLCFSCMPVGLASEVLPIIGWAPRGAV